MSSSASSPEGVEKTQGRRQNAISLLLFLLIGAAFLTRFFISPQIMNSFMRYTDEAGAFYEKLHIGTYAIFALLPIAFLIRPVFLSETDVPKVRALVYFIVWLGLLMALMFVLGRSAAAGYIIDSYVMAAAAGLLMFAVGEPVRRQIGNVILAMLTLSALIGIGEAMTETRLLPYSLVELTFRPTGLTEHPLTLGMMSAVAIGFVAATRLSVPAKFGAILLLFVGTAAAEARLATLLSVAAILAILISVPWTKLTLPRERKAKAVVLLLALASGGMLIALLYAGGLLSRFSGSLFDENFFARITIYEIFGYVGWREVVFGTDVLAILKIVNEKLGLPYIESTPVILIFQFGLPLALGFAGLVVYLFRTLLRDSQRPALIATITFFLAALSNNALSTKTPTIAIMIVLLIAYAAAPPPRERPTGGAS
ncbi:MAG: VpsF family polysaccharide biosynthesis protein [Devosia sp.]